MGFHDFALHHLPLYVMKNERLEIVGERQNYLLFDRMVAFHVQRRRYRPYVCDRLLQRSSPAISRRDGMYFLPSR